MSEDDAADDDWFERALEGEETSAAAAAEETPSDGESGDGDADDPDAEAFGDDPDGDELDAAFEEAAAAASADETAGGATGDAGDSADGGAETDAFGEAADADPFGEAGDADPFGEAGETDPFAGGVDTDEGGDLFDDDFASAFGGGETEEFDDEDFESDIPRLDVGIAGLDRMIQGGVPERHLMTTIGSAGTGKTTFGLQYLNHGLERGENGVFITLEQSHDAIVDTAEEHGWAFEEYEAEDRLAVVDLDPVEMANSLDNVRVELPTLIEEFDADRFVLDSVSLLEMMYDEQARRRTEIFDFTRSLKRAGVTTLLTSEAAEDNPYASRHGIIEYLTDAVFILQYVRGETNETRLAVEIQKIRNANHSRETKPYEITDDGISVYEQANIF